MTPEWVLQKLPDSAYADGDGNIMLWTGSQTSFSFIMLALDTLDIIYEIHDFLEDNDEVVFGFEFRLKDIQVECPILYKTMREMDLNNFIHKNSNKN